MIKQAIQTALNSLGYEIRKLPMGRRKKVKIPPGLHEMRDDRTYNPSHPNYDANKVKNYPGAFYPVKTPTDRTEFSRTNPLFQQLLLEKGFKATINDPMNYDFVRPRIQEVARELDTDPNFTSFLSKLKTLDSYISDLNKQGPGRYYHGGLDLEDAKFLYWLVRAFKPKKIVQTGTSNGISCALITIALEKNGGEGKLFAVDMPEIYNPKDPAWQVDCVYGVVIPEGKSSGWLVPDALKNRFEVRTGDAKKVLPGFLDEIGEIDLFYHDSDHTYGHMLFEFEESYPHLRKHGLILADDIAWSTVTWDFAEQKGCFALNHAGSQGLIFV